MKNYLKINPPLSGFPLSRFTSISNLLGVALLMGSTLSASQAEEKTPAAPAEVEGEQVDVDSIKKKYWARGDESQVTVVQNRTYTKAKKFEFSAFGGIVTTDPFLSVKNVGGSFGYHLNEYWSFHLIAFKDLVGKSSALTSFEDFSGGTANTNHPKSFYGAEGSLSLLYGKLSLLGASIIYYDLQLSAGAGSTKTESGDYLTPMGGIGQRFYLSKNVSLKFDYRLQYYRERILEKQVPNKKGELRGHRTNFSNCVTIGVGFMFGPGSKEPSSSSGDQD